MKKLLSLFLVCIFVFAMPMTVLADSASVVTLGADITEAEKQAVLSYFGITDINSVEVVQVNNAEEHSILDAYIPPEKIGNKTYSCAYIVPTTSGGLNIQMQNITYVTQETLANALMTAGINNCNLMVTAPKAVSGTGALAGVYKAYDKMGVALDSSKKDLAVQEMVVVSQLVENHGNDINKVVAEVKKQVADKALTDTEVKQIIIDTANEHNISLTEEETEKLLSIVDQIMKLDYNVESFVSSVNSTIDEITGKTNSAKEFITNIFNNIKGFFEKLSGKEDSATPKEGQ